MKANNYHIRATLLPDGDTPVDLWITEGKIYFDARGPAVDLAPAGGFISPGLVDAHSHISFPDDSNPGPITPGTINANRLQYAQTGVLLLRDMGASGNEFLSMEKDPYLPRIQACGRVLLMHAEPPYVPTPPDALERTAKDIIRRGAPWVKIFADWSTDYRGPRHVGFSGRDELTYPPAILAATTKAVHEEDGRVAIHCFTRQAAEVGISLGVDSIEHGWGLDEELVERMAGGHTAWIPTLSIARGMRWEAGRHDEPERLRWIDERLEALRVLIPLAHRKGVPILVGTDWFPGITVAEETLSLHSFGLSRDAAMAAATTTARTFLRENGLDPGAPADLVLFRKDPRQNLSELSRPERILMNGRSITPQPPPPIRKPEP